MIRSVVAVFAIVLFVGLAVAAIAFFALGFAVGLAIVGVVEAALLAIALLPVRRPRRWAYRFGALDPALWPAVRMPRDRSAA